MLVAGINIRSGSANGTIYIRADGSIDPSSAPIYTVDNVTYTFTGDIYDSIVVERNSVVLDGSGYAVQGYWALEGIDLTGRSNVTIRNMNIEGFRHGVYLFSSSNSSVGGNNITNNAHGIWLEASSNNIVGGNNITNMNDGVDLYSSSNNTVSGNNITASLGGFGIWLCFSSNNSINGNSMTSNSYGIFIEGSSGNTVSGNNVTGSNYDGIFLGELSSNNSIGGNNLADNHRGVELSDSSYNSVSGNVFLNDGLVIRRSCGNAVIDNLVNGKQLVYLEGVSDYAVEDAGQVILVNCNRITVENLDLSHTAVGVQLLHTNNTKISRNIITANNQDGVYFGESSSDNTVSGNIITANRYCGIWLESCSNNSMNGNIITANNGGGILLRYSSDNTVSGNIITANNWAGIFLYDSSSSNNSVSRNNIANNYLGIRLYCSSNNSIYHNDFVNNTQQAYFDYPSDESVNAWDDGYPSGGNYWSDYSGTDMYSGHYQNETGSDGIGDLPYIFDAKNQDNYPLTIPWSSETIQESYVTRHGEPYTVQVASNATVLGFKETPGSIKISVSGESVTSGYVRIVQPVGLNATDIKVFMNNTRLNFPSTDPPRSISTNGTHYFIYFAFTFNSIYEFTVAFPVMGDINYDGTVEMMDFYIASQAYLSTPEKPNWNPNADINDDGMVEMMDFYIMSQHYLEQW
jgi:parallel beta-helix repeat protein